MILPGGRESRCLRQVFCTTSLLTTLLLRLLSYYYIDARLSPILLLLCDRDFRFSPTIASSFYFHLAAQPWWRGHRNRPCVNGHAHLTKRPSVPLRPVDIPARSESMRMWLNSVAPGRSRLQAQLPDYGPRPVKSLIQEPTRALV
ncbi:hypothetical protein V8C34DRAFT_165944 [Trichoderma compactum]